VYDVLHEKMGEADGADFKRNKRARHLLMQIVNALGTKMEIGSPMAAMYLLKNPDHYTSHRFVLFWWQSWVADVRRSWATEDMMKVDGDSD
ncbi:hypothetical protein B0H10DRAFT_1733253, partial [Mycena sp. CBHHK59/15]